MVGGSASLFVLGLAVGLVLTLSGVAAVAFRRRRQMPADTDNEGMLRSAAMTLTKTGDEFLPAVVKEMAVALDANLAFIGEFASDDVIQTVAVYRSGQPGENFEYPLRGTPCEQLANTPQLCYPMDVAQLFPADSRLTMTNAQGYVGALLIGSRETPVGVIGVVTPEPIKDEANAASILQLFAGRVAAEMQRSRTERELRKSEDHLLQVQRVEAIGRLAGGIAHDFNNLLMIVIGYGEILRDRDGASPEVTELLAAANRATTLTRQLLAFGRRQVMQVQHVDMNRVVTSVQTMLTRVIGAQVRVTTSLHPMLASVEADAGQMEQVLVNLAINARDAMPDGGTLLLQTSVEDIAQPYAQMPAGKYVCLSVIDTGTGMTPDVQAHIFEPFFTTKGNAGTGLGLSSVYGIVKQSGGFIWCHSEVGKGTTFKIYFRPSKAEVEEAPVAPETAPEQARGGVERILVVDDEPGVRKLLARILRTRGYEVSEAEDGASALAFMEKSGDLIDMVVTDIVMPGMSGTKLAEGIHDRWPAVKLMFVSGYPQGAALATGLAAQIPVLGKPFTPARITVAVRDLLDGKVAAQPRSA
jgi:signal transduction histidine kinase/ActR/RegA family two-component response regulator